MAGREFPFRTSGGQDSIPTTDGDYFTEDMSQVDGQFQAGECFLQFYNLDGNGQLVPVTPTGGTIEFRSAAFPNQFLTPAAANTVTIQAADVDSGNADYTPPSFGSLVRQSKMTLSGITGATHVKAFHWRYTVGG